MNRKIKYTNEPLGDLKVVPDFLPRPEDLVFQKWGQWGQSPFSEGTKRISGL